MTLSLPLSLTHTHAHRAAQGTSLNRYIIPEWRTPGVQAIGANGEKFGFDQYAKVNQTQAKEGIGK